MDFKLRVLKGQMAGREVRVPVPKFFIGRAEDCHLKPKTDLISRHHCVLIVEEQRAAVRDLGSRNGTFVNNEQVLGEMELNHGDQLRVGPLEFEVRLTHTAKKKPRVTSVKEAVSRVAAGGSAHGEVDINKMLGSDRPPEPSQRDLPAETRELTDEPIEAAETEELSLDATTIIKPGDIKPDEVTPGQPDAATPAQPDEATPEPTTPRRRDRREKKSTPGKLPPMPKTMAEDSGTAAADVLQKLFRRR